MSVNPHEYSATLRYLRTHGYEEVEQLNEAGQFVVRGDILIVWPAGAATSCRFHYLGELLERWEGQVEGKWQEGQGEAPLLPANVLKTEHGDIRPGEYIVHPHHGVGIFQGIIEQHTHDGGTDQFIALAYAGNDRLLVPFERQAELMPYIGTRHPRLTRLYSKAWQHTKERVQRDLIKVARQLLKIYAARQLHERPLYPPAGEWQAELSKSVDFSLTDDQERALREIRGDLEKVPYPMDRLLCGDVGFGKTEVVLRAAAQAVASGRQVAFLAPTTVLVEQHYSLLEERFAALPIRVAHLSRLTKGSDASTLAAIREGTVDVVVGTHRLLGNDIQWKHLGLLVVDEEQKFGVAQKEKLKALRPTVDVLSMSATPIPRTLSMSLSGLRSLSILRRAPRGRLPVKTQVEEYHEALFGQVLAEELHRGGQIYVVHNRVQPLPIVAEKVRELVKQAGFAEARIGIAHGQLPEVELATTMAKFMRRELDILVASTIVENGLDSPHANTLVVLRSEQFGLADLYQLRGRVGRRATQAYAYFMLGSVEHGEGYALQNNPDQPPPSDSLPTAAGIALTKTARQRLQALLEADELGSGWTVALRDLEIRGGGNILGHEQHGSMEAIGLLLYAQLLQEEIGRQAQKLGIPLFQKKEG